MTEENKCLDCEKQLFLENMRLTEHTDRLEKWVELLQKCLDGKEELCNFYRNTNEELLGMIKAKNEQIRRLQNKIKEGTK